MRIIKRNDRKVRSEKNEDTIGKVEEHYHPIGRIFSNTYLSEYMQRTSLPNASTNHVIRLIV